MVENQFFEVHFYNPLSDKLIFSPNKENLVEIFSINELNCSVKSFKSLKLDDKDQSGVKILSTSILNLALDDLNCISQEKVTTPVEDIKF